MTITPGHLSKAARDGSATTHTTPTATPPTRPPVRPGRPQATRTEAPIGAATQAERMNVRCADLCADAGRDIGSSVCSARLRFDENVSWYASAAVSLRAAGGRRETS